MFLLHTLTKWLYCNQNAIGPFRVSLLVKAGWHLVGYSRMIDVFLLRVIERKDMVHAHAGSQNRQSLTL